MSYENPFVDCNLDVSVSATDDTVTVSTFETKTGLKSHSLRLSVVAAKDLVRKLQKAIGMLSDTKGGSE